MRSAGNARAGSVSIKRPDSRRGDGAVAGAVTQAVACIRRKRGVETVC